MRTAFHERLTLGFEIEAYTIQVPGFAIGQARAMPRKGLGEKGERFTRDETIGTEYNSPPFSTIRQGLFLVKAGLRKYNREHYQSRPPPRRTRHLLLVGGWRDCYAGAHLHLTTAGRELDHERAKKLAWHLHDHLPFLIALGANSPVWGDELTQVASNRVLGGSHVFFKPLARGVLTQHPHDELVFSRGRKRKPPSLEIRVVDSNVPEYLMAAACVVKAIGLNWLGRGRTRNRLKPDDYRRARSNAAAAGMAATLCWNGEWIPATEYLDRFIWSHRQQLRSMDIPAELWDVFRLLKRRWDGSLLVRAAVEQAQRQSRSRWSMELARRYRLALDRLLSGNTLADFADALEVKLPAVGAVWLGRRHLEW